MVAKQSKVTTKCCSANIESTHYNCILNHLVTMLINMNKSPKLFKPSFSGTLLSIKKFLFDATIFKN